MKLAPLYLFLCIISTGILDAQTSIAGLEARLRSLEQRVTNLEAAQPSDTRQKHVTVGSPAVTAMSPRTTEEIERTNIQAISPHSRIAHDKRTSALGGTTGTGASAAGPA